MCACTYADVHTHAPYKEVPDERAYIGTGITFTYIFFLALVTCSQKKPMVQREITGVQRGNTLFSCFSVRSIIAAIGDCFQTGHFGGSTAHTV